MPKLVFIHTVPALAERFRVLAETMLGDWSSEAVVDDRLLLDTIENGRVSDETAKRLAAHIQVQIETGADAIVVTCSTLGGTVDAIRPTVSVPLLRIDRAMAEQAILTARRIGVLATLPTTLEPTRRLLEEIAKGTGEDREISAHLCEGAFALLRAGDREGHDVAVRAGFSHLADHVDLMVLAQASMADAFGTLPQGSLPYLTSPQIGMAAIASQLRSLDVTSI
ncbi:MAG: aspartate/glutamate racemase family protein [Rhizobium sp.]|nr:aspartate/glutamate racemase family protein [Rhizobium sp.]